MEHTPTVSDHARDRCAEMGISTKVAKRIVQNPSLTWPGHTAPTRQFIRSDLHPEYVVVYDTAVDRIITVAFYSTEPYVRNGETFIVVPEGGE